MPEASDMDLVREYARHNSEPAFAELVRRHINLVYSVALRWIGNTQDAQDIAQAVFVILAKKATGLPEKTILTGWLYETTRFTAMSFLRNTGRRRIFEQEACMQSTLNDSDADSAWEQINPLIEEAMARLSEKDRTLLALRFYENKSGAEVAGALGIEEWAARKRIERAVEKLRAFFARRGMKFSAAVFISAVSANSIQAAPAALATAATAAGVAKGVAASGSTLTLIKGALKIMAWTKAKTAMVAGMAIILAAGTTTVVVEKIRTPTIDEAWWKPDYAIMKKVPPLVAVRRSKPGRSEVVVMDNRGLNLIGQSLSPKFLFAFAYFFTDMRTVLPDELAAERFDAILTVPDHQHEGLQKELKKKLGYTGTIRTIEADALLLKVKSPEALKLKITTDATETKFSPTSARILMKNQSIAQLAANLESRFEKPVLDETGLTNRYDISMPNLWRKNSKDGYGVSNEIAKLELQQMLDEIGLELMPNREAIEVLVVEKVK